jgi:hypothetical protein
MRIRSLSLTNYRGFADAVIDLDRPVTVLAGVNGSGKSSLLQGAAMVFTSVLRHAWSAHDFAGWLFEDLDLHVGSDAVVVKGHVTNGAMDSSVELSYHRGTVGRAPFLLQGGTVNLVRVAPCLPVFYTAGRGVAHGTKAFVPPLLPTSQPRARADVFDALDPGGQNGVGFGSFFRWFKEREDVENEARVSKKDLSFEDPPLGAVRRAVAGMLPGFSGLRIQRDPLHMIVQKDAATLAIDQLSDGERMLLAMTADLARRLSIAYSDAEDPLRGEAVVLIDELEQHLHPRWHRTALTNLRTTFPGCQFIVTTHSPLVLGSVPRESVLVLDNFEVVHPNAKTEGRDVNAILAEVMGVPDRLESVVVQITKVGEWLDVNELDRAREALVELEQKLGWTDSEVIRLRTRLEFLERPFAGDPA